MQTDLLALVEGAGDDAGSADRIEAARDQVREEHLPALVDCYWRLASWPARRALVELIQDHARPVSVPAMKHFLASAPADAGGAYDHALAVAASHVDGDLSRFEHYYDDPVALGGAREAARKGSR